MHWYPAAFHHIDQGECCGHLTSWAIDHQGEMIGSFGLGFQILLDDPFYGRFDTLVVKPVHEYEDVVGL